MPRPEVVAVAPQVGEVRLERKLDRGLFQLPLQKDIADLRSHGNDLGQRHFTHPSRLGLPDRLQRGVHRDPVKPSRKTGVAAEGGQGAQGPNPRLLGVVVRQVVVTGNASHDRVHPG